MSNFSWRDEAAPTHRCKECSAMWRFWRASETGDDCDTWNLRSAVCGQCCDCAEMGDQIEPLTLGELEKYLAARLAVEAMTQHFAGLIDRPPTTEGE